MGRPKLINDEQILHHAREVFLEAGAAGATREIARRAGVAEATLFQRFPTKAALFLAAMMPPAIDMSGIVTSDKADLREALTEIGENMLRFFRELIPGVMHLMTNPAISMKDVAAHYAQNPSEALTEALVQYLQNADRLGHAKVPNAMAAASLFVAAIHSLAVFELMGIHGGADLEHAVAFFVDALWNGLRP